MLIRQLHNKYSEENPLTNGKLVYMNPPSGTGSGVNTTDAQAAAAEEKKKKKARKKAEKLKKKEKIVKAGEPSIGPSEGKDGARRFDKHESYKHLQELRTSVDAYPEQGQAAKELIGELDQGIGQINEYAYYNSYLSDAVKQIESTGGWWLIPDDQGASEKLVQFRNNLAEVAVKLGKKGKKKKINEIASKREALSIVNDLLKTSKGKKEKKEKEVINKTDRTILALLDDVEKNYANSPHKQEALKAKVGAIKETMDILNAIKGKSKDQRIKILSERENQDYSYLNQASQGIETLITNEKQGGDLRIILAEFKAFLIWHGVRSGDVVRMKAFINKILDRVVMSSDKRGTVDKVKVVRNRLEMLEDSTSDMVGFIGSAHPIIFPEEYGIKLTADDLAKLKVEADYADDIAMRRQLLNGVKGMYGESGEAMADASAADKITIPDLKKRFAELEQEKKEKVDKYAGKLQSEANRLKGRMGGLEALVRKKLGEDGAKEHTTALEKAKESLDSWANVKQDYDSSMYGSKPNADPKDLIDPNTGEIREGDKLGIQNYIRLAEDPNTPEAAQKAAKLCANDMINAASRQFDFPKETAERFIDEYDEEIDRYVTELEDETQEGGGWNIMQGKFGNYQLYFLSIHDFKRIGEKLKEWAERRYNRRSDKNIGDFGSKVFANLPGPLKTMGNEFERIREQSEIDEVEQYKQAYQNKDAWEITAIMYKTRNQDEMKACLYLLADMGRIRWDKTELWEQMMYFSHGAIQFNLNDPDAEIMNQSKLHEKLQKCVGVIWDYDTFQEWQTTNEQNAVSKMEAHTDFCHKTAEMPGTLDKVCRVMLAEYKKQKRMGIIEPKVDPQKYEKIIHYNIEFGKGSPEGKLYYLIQGVACGLLSRDAAVRINGKWINHYPVIDLFGSETEMGEKPTMEDIRQWALLDGDKNEPGGAFRRWFYTYVIHRPRVYQRVDKALTQGLSQDHDDATCWYGAMSVTTAQTILSQNSQGFRMPITGYQNASLGMLAYLDNLGETYDMMGSDGETGGEAQLIRFASMFATFDGISKGRIHKDRPDFFRWKGEEHLRPRYVGHYADDYGRDIVSPDGIGGAKTSAENLTSIRDYIRILDPELFGFLFDRSATASEGEIANFVNAMKKKYNNNDLFGENGAAPAHNEGLHEAMPTVLRNIFHTSEGRKKRREMLNKIQEDHRNMEAQLQRANPEWETVDERVRKMWGDSGGIRGGGADGGDSEGVEIEHDNAVDFAA